jgi:hypothetical protein
MSEKENKQILYEKVRKKFKHKENKQRQKGREIGGKYVMQE